MEQRLRLIKCKLQQESHSDIRKMEDGDGNGDGDGSSGGDGLGVK